MGSLKTLHNWAKDRYNDEDEERLNIRLSPFNTIKYKMSAAKKREIVKRAVSPTALRYLWAVPTNLYNDRAASARDAFFLSFALCGMNAVDMWKHKMEEDAPEDLIEYYRSKTVDRSGSDSFIRVHVHPFVMNIHRKHRDRRKTWDWGRYSSANSLNCTLCRGMKSMVETAVEYYGEKWGMNPQTEQKKILRQLELPLDGSLDFYAARHSFATIAVNDCHVSEDVVNRCQCHASRTIAANSYIKKDYRFTDETVAKVMECVFGEFMTSPLPSLSPNQSKIGVE